MNDRSTSLRNKQKIAERKERNSSLDSARYKEVDGLKLNGDSHVVGSKESVKFPMIQSEFNLTSVIDEVRRNSIERQSRLNKDEREFCCSCRQMAEDLDKNILTSELEKLRIVLAQQTCLLRERIASADIFASWRIFEQTKEGIEQGKEMLIAINKFLAEFLAVTAAELREALSSCALFVQERLEEDYKPFREEYGMGEMLENQLLKSMIRTTIAQESYVDLTIQLRRMEALAVEVELSTNRLAAYLGQTAAEARRVEVLLRQANDSGVIAIERNLPDILKKAFSLDNLFEHQHINIPTIEIHDCADESITIAPVESIRAPRYEKPASEIRVKLEQPLEQNTDPKTWPHFVIDIDDEEETRSNKLGCVLRVPSKDAATFDSTQIKCTLVDGSNPIGYQAQPNEEVVSNMILLRDLNGNELFYKTGVWIVLPCATISRYREYEIKLWNDEATNNDSNDVIRTNNGLDVVTNSNDVIKTNNNVYVATNSNDVTKTNNGVDVAMNSNNIVKWNSAIFKETSYAGGQTENQKYVEVSAHYIGKTGLGIVVISKPKCEKLVIGSKGGVIKSSIDSRIALTIPRHFYKNKNTVSMQVLFSMEVLPNLRERYNAYQVTAASPVTIFNIPDAEENRGVAFLLYKLPLLAIRRNEKRDDEFEELVVLVTKDAAGGKWKLRDEIVVHFDNELASFTTQELLNTLVLLRLDRALESPTVGQIAARLDLVYHERECCIVAATHPDTRMFYLEFCKFDDIATLMRKIQDDGFTEGIQVQEKLLLQEEDVIKLKFRGNICFENVQEKYLIYRSNFSAPKIKSKIKPIDHYAQNALPSYRGVVKLTVVKRIFKTPSNILSITNQNPNNNGQPQKMSERLKSVSQIVDNSCNVDICEIMVLVPKVESEPPIINRIEVPIQYKGILNSSYFEELSIRLGGEWMSLGKSLNLTDVTLQRILCASARLQTDGSNPAVKQMLVQWYKTAPISKDKTIELYKALLLSGRKDLAENLKFRMDNNKD